MEQIEEIRGQLQHRIQAIYLSCEKDSEEWKTAATIEESIKNINSLPEKNQQYNRLWELEYGYLSPLYHEVVVKRSQAGLLRSSV